jgi:NAD(P)H-dependent FMN reductase
MRAVEVIRLYNGYMDCELLVISASNGENLKLAERFASSGRQRGLGVAVLDLTALELPLFTPRAQALGLPPGISHLNQQLAAAPLWVICAPEYNGGIPPVITNAIAWLSVQGDDFRSLFNSRPVVIATHSGGGGHNVLTALRLQLAYLGAQVVGRQVVSNSKAAAKESSIDDLIEQLQLLPPPLNSSVAC